MVRKRYPWTLSRFLGEAQPTMLVTDPSPQVTGKPPPLLAHSESTDDSHT